jgi:hypothetical protein
MSFTFRDRFAQFAVGIDEPGLFLAGGDRTYEFS